MLGSLLPGFRHVRAPLISGIVWAALCWLSLEPTVGAWIEEHKLNNSLANLISTLGVAGRATAFFFLAYLLGTLSDAVFSRILNQLTASGAKSIQVTDTNYAIAPYLAEFGPDSVFQTGYTSGLSTRAADSLFTEVARKVNGAVDQLSTQGEGLSRIREPIFRRVWLDVKDPAQDDLAKRELQRLDEVTYFLRIQSPPKVIADPVSEDETLRRKLVIRYAQAIAGDIENMGVQLIGREDGLFSEIDRFRSEAELRIAMIPALVGVMIALAQSGVEFWFVGFFVLFLAWDQATHAIESANDLTIDSIVLGRLVVPELERLSSLENYRASTKSNGEI